MGLGLGFPSLVFWDALASALQDMAAVRVFIWAASIHGIQGGPNLPTMGSD